MLVKKIKFEDFLGNEREQDFYFNLSKSEIIEMNMVTSGGLEAHITKIMQTLNGPEIMATFKNFILKSYGEMSDDGLHFVKSPELAEAFSHTNAYDELFVELLNDPDAAAAFFNGIMPKIDQNKNIPAPALTSVN